MWSVGNEDGRIEPRPYRTLQWHVEACHVGQAGGVVLRPQELTDGAFRTRNSIRLREFSTRTASPTRSGPSGRPGKRQTLDSALFSPRDSAPPRTSNSGDSTKTVKERPPGRSGDPISANGTGEPSARTTATAEPKPVPSGFGSRTWVSGGFGCAERQAARDRTDRAASGLCRFVDSSIRRNRDDRSTSVPSLKQS